MFESTFEKYLIQLSVELILPDIPCNLMNHTQYRVELALPIVASNLFRKLIQISENIWMGSVFLSVYSRLSGDPNERASFTLIGSYTMTVNG